MKRVFIFIMMILMLTFGFSSCKKENRAPMRIAFFTTNSVNDKSFNQIGFDAVKNFMKTHNCVVKNFLTNTSQSTDIGNAFRLASSERFNVFVLMGYTYTKALVLNAAKYTDVRFIGIDINDMDIYSMAESLGMSGYKIPKNVYCCSYHEEIAGFMAGYAAVYEGYTHLGFVGGKALPAVIRYGLGYVQGINRAAAELGISQNVIVEYIYNKNFTANENITAKVTEWLDDGLQVVFPCGGGIWTSVCEAAARYNARVIGVDTDQSEFINDVSENMCLTSAVKNIDRTISVILDAIEDDKFDDFGGRADTLGMVSGDKPEMNFVGLPLQSWSMQKWTKSDYAHLLSRINNGEITVTGSPDDKPEFSITLNVFPLLK